MPPRSTPFVALAETAAAVGATRSKNAKRDLLAAYLRGLPPGDLPAATVFFAGRPLIDQTAKLGLGWVQQGAALAAASGAGEDALRAAYLRHSDFGDAAADLVTSGTGKPLTVADVATGFAAIAAAGSAAERVSLMTDLYRRATTEEARFIGRVASRETRIGLREGLLEEAIATAFDAEPEAVRRAHMLTGEIGETAVLAREGRLAEAALHVGRPIRFMLASPVADADEVMRRVGDEAWIEDKYDGIRAQLHLEARRDAEAVQPRPQRRDALVPGDRRSGEFSRGRGTARHRRRARSLARGIGARLRLAPDPPRPGAAVARAVGRGARRARRVRPSPPRRAGPARAATPRAPRGARCALPAGTDRRADPAVASGHRTVVGRGRSPLRRRPRAPQRRPDGQGPRARRTSPAGAALAGSS